MPGLTSHSKKNMVSESESESESVFWGVLVLHILHSRMKRRNCLLSPTLTKFSLNFGF